jgi:hypothetical protein
MPITRTKYAFSFNSKEKSLPWPYNIAATIKIKLNGTGPSSLSSTFLGV